MEETIHLKNKLSPKPSRWSNRRGSGRVGGITEGGAAAAQSGRVIKEHVCGVVLKESYPTACEE